MDLTNKLYLDDEDSPILKTIKGATTGLAAGFIWGTVLATWHDVPRVERHVALPGLIRTLKMCGSHGLTFAAVGGLYIGVEQLVQHQRAKMDFVNGAVGAFIAGAAVFGFKGILPLSIYIIYVICHYNMKFKCALFHLLLCESGHYFIFQSSCQLNSFYFYLIGHICISLKY